MLRVLSECLYLRSNAFVQFWPGYPGSGVVASVSLLDFLVACSVGSLFQIMSLLLLSLRNITFCYTAIEISVDVTLYVLLSQFILSTYPKIDSSMSSFRDYDRISDSF